MCGIVGLFLKSSSLKPELGRLTSAMLHEMCDRGPDSGTHVAFRTEDRETVHAFHEAALAAGGRDNGGPGLREIYHPNYYGAFVLDPDGNNIEAVFHGELG